jgi:hypothetical protein
MYRTLICVCFWDVIPSMPAHHHLNATTYQLTPRSDQGPKSEMPLFKLCLTPVTRSGARGTAHNQCSACGQVLKSCSSQHPTAHLFCAERICSWGAHHHFYLNERTTEGIIVYTVAIAGNKPELCVAHVYIESVPDRQSSSPLKQGHRLSYSIHLSLSVFSYLLTPRVKFYARNIPLRLCRHGLNTIGDHQSTACLILSSRGRQSTAQGFQLENLQIRAFGAPTPPTAFLVRTT